MPPQTPQIDTATAKASAVSIHDTLIGLGNDWNIPRWLSEPIGMGIGGIVFCLSYVVLVLMQVLIALGSWLGAQYITLIGTAKDDNQDAMNELIAASTNEMLGTSISAGDLKAGSGGASSMEENQQIGDALLTLFEQAFGVAGPVTPDQGAANARKFAGFNINFAISQGFLSILGEAASFGFLKEFHELPDGLRNSLGLGRLARVALQPLIRNAIQQPYDLSMRARFRPDRLSEGQLVAALHAGNMEESDVRQQLAEKGYPDDAIDVLLTELTAKLSIGDLILLLNNGEIQEKDVIDNLTIEGMTEASAQQQLRAAQLGLQQGQVSSYLSELETQYVNGYIDEPTWNSIVSKLPLGDDQEQMYRNRVGLRKEGPRTAVSFSQVSAAIVAGITDFSYLDQWMEFHGYSDQDQLILSWEVIAAMKKQADAEAAKAYKAALLQKAGKPVPPWLQP